MKGKLWRWRERALQDFTEKTERRAKENLNNAIIRVIRSSGEGEQAYIDAVVRARQAAHIVFMLMPPGSPDVDVLAARPANYEEALQVFKGLIQTLHDTGLARSFP